MYFASVDFVLRAIVTKIAIGPEALGAMGKSRIATEKSRRMDDRGGLSAFENSQNVKIQTGTRQEALGNRRQDRHKAIGARREG